MGGHNHCAYLPRVAQALFVTLSPFQGRSPDEPSDVPWTHRPPAPDAGSALVADIAYLDADDPSAGGDDGSSDLTPDEIAALPDVGLVGPRDVPAVNLCEPDRVSEGSSTDFVGLNKHFTSEVVAALRRAGRESAVLVEAPPGAGKSTLTCSVAHSLVQAEKHLTLPIITQTNEQADDIVSALHSGYPGLPVGRLVGGRAIESIQRLSGSTPTVSSADTATRVTCGGLV